MVRRRSNTSTSRLGRGRSAGGADRDRQDGGPVHQRVSGGRRIMVLKQKPRVWVEGTAYPEQTYRWPSFVLRKGCAPPLSTDCTQLQITPRWAVACFKPTYHNLRAEHGDDYNAVVEGMMESEVPSCAQQPVRGAEHELRRRIALAVAVLMNREGLPVQYPTTARFPRPAKAEAISQPWLRALITGWF